MFVGFVGKLTTAGRMLQVNYSQYVLVKFKKSRRCLMIIQGVSLVLTVFLNVKETAVVYTDHLMNDLS